MSIKERQSRAVPCSPNVMDEFLASDSPWFESPEQLEKRFRAEAEKRLLLTWVRRQMERTLTDAERRCVDLHYFGHYTCREVGEITGVCPSTVYRTLQRAIRKLRAAKEKSVVMRHRTWH